MKLGFYCREGGRSPGFIIFKWGPNEGCCVAASGSDSIKVGNYSNSWVNDFSVRLDIHPDKYRTEILNSIKINNLGHATYEKVRNFLEQEDVEIVVNYPQIDAQNVLFDINDVLRIHVDDHICSLVFTDDTVNLSLGKKNIEILKELFMNRSKGRKI